MSGAVRAASTAALKFFLYTFLGSVLMLVALIYLYMKGGSFQLADLYALPLSAKEQTWIFFAFLIAFAVKVPMFPSTPGCRTPTWKRRPPVR